jgi:tetratricopeptide (TPR) repeat protein
MARAPKTRGGEAVRRLGEAITAPRPQVLAAAPVGTAAQAASQHELGLALLAAGRLEEAMRAFAAAIRLDPGMATAHHNLGVVLDNLGHTDRALACYETAARLKPDLVVAQARLADLHLARRQTARALVALRAVAAAAAGPVKGRIAEARALDVAGDFAGSLAAMRAIVESNPKSAEAHMLLGQFLGQAGHPAEAAAHYERAASLGPDLVGAWNGVATHRTFGAGDGPLIKKMNDGLARRTLKPAQRQGLHFALGKAHDDMGHHALAMKHYDAANKLRGQGLIFNGEALVRRIDQLIAATPPGYLDRLPHPGVADATPILIVGMPRSGSTLVEQILTSHPGVAGGGELAFWNDRAPLHADLWSVTPTPEATAALAADYLSVLRAFGAEAARVTDKALNNFAFAGLIHRVFPKATIVHVRRHPIDTCLSIYKTDFEGRHSFAADRGNIAFFYRQYQRMMAHWRAVLPSDRLIDVDYEALVADPEPHARRLIAACGLDWDDACLAPERNTRRVATASVWQARQPIYRSSVERWRRYEPWLGALRSLSSD